MSDYFGGINILRKKNGGNSVAQNGIPSPVYKTLPSGPYTILATDWGKTFIVNTSENKTITIPNGMPIGVIDILNDNCEITFVATSGNLLGDGNILATDETAATLYSRGSNTYSIYGRLTSI